ncbi:ParA family protein [Jeongeupia naejangsanensis]|uniref:ParA family protein n=1 Tax=Jeongeupia naejangsanensis TaxID=613195 RepID=A0ABS2BFV3_9NEIS|nr:ParA family protein [Jeongeupia naejangsanensis]MBM3114481.1 ParA family protein [Jeongeupia naejangsanensis]
MTTIAVFNQKGGVGKTTVTANLAAAMAQNGTAPLVIDLDPQAHLSHYWGFGAAPGPTIHDFFRGVAALSDLVRPLPNGIDFIPSELALSKVDAQLTRHRDHLWRLQLGLTAEMLADHAPVLIDCGPMLGVLGFSALLAADLVLVPVSPETLALHGARMSARTLAGLERLLPRKPRRYLLNRYQSGNISSEHALRQLRHDYPGEVLGATIRPAELYEAAVIRHADVFSLDPDSDAAQDMALLLDELIETGLIAL